MEDLENMTYNDLWDPKPTPEELEKIDEIMAADMESGIMFDKIRDDPRYPFSQLDRYK